MILAMLDAIANRIHAVSPSVQATVAELLRANLDSRLANMGLMTAAIMAINPKNTVLKAANDDKFQIAA
jgi:hypothetical protein